MLQRNASLPRTKQTNDSLPWLTPKHIPSTPCPSRLPSRLPHYTQWACPAPWPQGPRQAALQAQLGNRGHGQMASTKPKFPFTSISQSWGLSSLFLRWLWAITRAIWRVTQRDTLRLKVWKNNTLWRERAEAPKRISTENESSYFYKDETVGWHHWLTSQLLSKLQEMVMHREAWHAAVHEVAKSWTWLSDWTAPLLWSPLAKKAQVGDHFQALTRHLPQFLYLLGGVRDDWLGSWNFHHPPMGTSPPASDITRHPFRVVSVEACRESRCPLCPAIRRRPSPIQGVHGDTVGNMSFHPCQALRKAIIPSPH